MRDSSFIKKHYQYFLVLIPSNIFLFSVTILIYISFHFLLVSLSLFLSLWCELKEKRPNRVSILKKKQQQQTILTSYFNYLFQLCLKQADMSFSQLFSFMAITAPDTAHCSIQLDTNTIKYKKDSALTVQLVMPRPLDQQQGTRGLSFLPAFLIYIFWVSENVTTKGTLSLRFNGLTP